jgi:hypothetical protein
MTRTEVTLINRRGAYVPSTDSVPVVAGDAVSFSTSDGSAVYAFFSPEADTVLSPKPASPLAIGSGHKAELTFSSSKPGAYSAFFGADPKAGPSNFPGQSSSVLRLEMAMPTDPPPFSGGSETMNSGH